MTNEYQPEPFPIGWNDEGEPVKKYAPLDQHSKAFTKHWKAAQRHIKGSKEYLRQAEMNLALHLLELSRQRERFALEVSNDDLQEALAVGRSGVLNARKVLADRRIIRVDDRYKPSTWHCELLGPDGKPFPGETGSASQPRRIPGGKHGPDFIIR
jgi:hypothetical protein